MYLRKNKNIKKLKNQELKMVSVFFFREFFHEKNLYKPWLFFDSHLLLMVKLHFSKLVSFLKQDILEFSEITGPYILHTMINIIFKVIVFNTLNNK